MSDPAGPGPAASPAARPVHAVVVAYGAPGELEHCLETLGGEVPVLVVDNSSSDGVREVTTRAGASYRDAGENVGFAAAVNVALAELDLAEFDVLLLNPDAAIGPADLRRLQRALEESSDVACVAPAQRHPASGAELRVRWPWATPGGAWAEAIGLGRFRRRWGFVSASVLLVRGAALLDVGALDEGFFLYAEEADWERRATRAGWRVAFCPEAHAEHLWAATDPDGTRQQLRFHAGVERYVRKWHGALGWRSYQLATVLTALRRAIAGGGDRQRSLRLAGLYARGPSSVARRAGVVPDRAHGVPPLR